MQPPPSDLQPPVGKLRGGKMFPLGRRAAWLARARAASPPRKAFATIGGANDLEIVTFPPGTKIPPGVLRRIGPEPDTNDLSPKTGGPAVPNPPGPLLDVPLLLEPPPDSPPPDVPPLGLHCADPPPALGGAPPPPPPSPPPTGFWGGGEAHAGPLHCPPPKPACRALSTGAGGRLPNGGSPPVGGPPRRVSRGGADRRLRTTRPRRRRVARPARRRRRTATGGRTAATGRIARRITVGRITVGRITACR